MNCEDFEMLMADALGDELSPDDRPAFEAHLATCESCRRDFDSLSGTITTLRGLPGPVKVSVRREGTRLVIDDTSEGPTIWQASGSWQGRALLRHAASVLAAFLGGYALHASLAPASPDVRAPAGPTVVDPTVPDLSFDLHGALVRAHVHKPRRPDLAKALIALSGSGR